MMKRILGVLGMFFLCFILLGGNVFSQEDVAEIKNYSEIIRFFESDSYGIGKSLGAQYASVAYIPV